MVCNETRDELSAGMRSWMMTSYVCVLACKVTKSCEMARWDVMIMNNQRHDRFLINVICLYEHQLAGGGTAVVTPMTSTMYTSSAYDVTPVIWQQVLGCPHIVFPLNFFALSHHQSKTLKICNDQNYKRKILDGKT